jgi:ketosteroid isomerase-like protein
VSEENVGGYRHAVDAWNRGEIDELLAFMDEGIEFQSLLGAMEGAYRGHEGIRRWWQHFHETFPDWHADVEDVAAEGDVTIGRLRVRGHGRESGVPVDLVIWQAAEWRSGKIVRLTAHQSEAAARTAVTSGG